MIVLSACVPKETRTDTARGETEQKSTVVVVQNSCSTVDPFDTLLYSGNTNPSPRVINWGGGTGTGVIIDNRHVATAAHVVGCVTIPYIKVTMPDGTWRGMNVISANDDSDLAILEIDSADTFPGPQPPEYGPRPEVGDHVCSVTAYPKHAEYCGDVTRVRESPVGNDIEASFTVLPGNSGSPVYDVEGRLVGIVTKTGATFTSLSKHLTVAY